MLAIVQYGLFQEVGCDLQLALRGVVAAMLHHAVQHQDAPQHGVGEVVEFAAEVNHIVCLIVYLNQNEKNNQKTVLAIDDWKFFEFF